MPLALQSNLNLVPGLGGWFRASRVLCVWSSFQYDHTGEISFPSFTLVSLTGALKTGSQVWLLRAPRAQALTLATCVINAVWDLRFKHSS